MSRKARPHRLAPRVESLESRALLSVSGLDPDSTLFVRFRAGTSTATENSVLKSIQGQVVESYANGASLVQVASSAKRGAALKALSANRKVLYAEPNSTVVTTAFVPNDPGLSRQPGLESANNVDINATTAWATTQGTWSTIVAVIDSGLDLSHPEFAGRVWVNTAEANGAPGRDDDGNGYVDDVNGWNFQANSPNVYDDNGHGTHVAGIIGATGNNGQGLAGVNWGARILPLKFIGADGNGSVDDAIRAIYYAVNQGARVINASWGGSERIRALTDAIQYANSRNVVFVTAAGNESRNNGVRRSFPADDRLPNVLSVGAVDANGALASFSNFGKTTVDLVAPGVTIRSTVPGGYATYSGTSMAAPYVTGVVSLLVGLHPEMRASQLVQRVLNAARPLPGLQGKIITGGIVDAANTVSDAYAAAHSVPVNKGLQKRRWMRRLASRNRQSRVIVKKSLPITVSGPPVSLAQSAQVSVMVVFDQPPPIVETIMN